MLTSGCSLSISEKKQLARDVQDASKPVLRNLFEHKRVHGYYPLSVKIEPSKTHGDIQYRYMSYFQTEDGEHSYDEACMQACLERVDFWDDGVCHTECLRGYTEFHMVFKPDYARRPIVFLYCSKDDNWDMFEYSASAVSKGWNIWGDHVWDRP